MVFMFLLYRNLASLLTFIMPQLFNDTLSTIMQILSAPQHALSIIIDLILDIVNIIDIHDIRW